MLMLFIQQLGMGYSGTVAAAAPAADKGRDAGSGGHKEWWEGEWITPGVTHYVEKREGDISPAPARAEELRAKLNELPAEAKKDAEFKSLMGRTGALVRQAKRVELRALEAIEAQVEEAARQDLIDRIMEQHRLFAREAALLELRMEAIMAEQARQQAILARIHRDDEEVLQLILEMIDGR